MPARKTLNQQLEPSLAELADVLIGTPANDQVLKFNGTQWVNGTAAGGSVNWSGQAARTTNFNSVAGVWQEVEITGAGNIIGTLPVSPADNEEHLFVCRPTATDPGGRFRLGLNGKVINGRTDAATETRSTGFEQNNLATSFASLGGSYTISNNFQVNGPARPIFVRTGSYSLLGGGEGTSSLTWTLPTVAAGSSNLSFYSYENNGFGFRGRIIVNGVTVYTGSGGGGWVLVSINLSQSNNTVVFSNVNDYEAAYDDLTLTGVSVSAPASWTDVVPWQLNSGGRLAVRWNAAFQTWFVLEYYKGIYT